MLGTENKDFAAIMQRRPPNQRFDLARVYKGSVLEAEVLTITCRPENGKQVELRSFEQYSRIERFTRVDAGPGNQKGGATL